jgi:hypothetical protein
MAIDAHRRVICAGRRRSSVTGRCPNVHTASTTRQNACSPRLKRSEIPPKGICQFILKTPAFLLRVLTSRHRAKYIEGLENRLGRMESLLRLSGLLSEADMAKTDLGTLEKRLADRSAMLNQSSKNSTGSGSVNPLSQTTSSHQSTPLVDSNSSPRSTGMSSESPKESEAELDSLSDMMCSLVTNNCGETRYIGIYRILYAQCLLD